MADEVIRADALGKMYRIGGPREQYKTLRDSITRALMTPVRRIRNPGHGSHNLETLWALKGVSFDVRRGEVIGIVGPNGAGKSTLLKILSRITRPSEGRLDLCGRVGSLLEVGTGFHPELTGRENVYLNGAILGMKKASIDRKFDEIVAFAEIERFLDTPVKRYSSGMYVRLAFSVAAHLDPEILIVDEVLSVGDLQFQRKCLGMMEGVSKSGRTVLLVSHNMSSIARLCTRALLLDRGSLVRDGSPEAVVGSYISDVLSASDSVDSQSLSRCPGTSQLRLVSASMIDEAGSPVTVVDIGKPVTLRIRYFVGTPGLTFRCAAGFHSGGVCAFTSVEPAESVREEVGIHYSELEVPENLLAEGDYSVSVSAFTSRGKKQHYCKASNVTVFQTFDPIHGDSARGDYGENLAGVMRPRLQWRVGFLGADLEP